MLVVKGFKFLICLYVQTSLSSTGSSSGYSADSLLGATATTTTRTADSDQGAEQEASRRLPRDPRLRPPPASQHRPLSSHLQEINSTPSSASCYVTLRRPLSFQSPPSSHLLHHDVVAGVPTPPPPPVRFHYPEGGGSLSRLQHQRTAASHHVVTAAGTGLNRESKI